MILEPWEIIILQLSYGSLLGGVVLFIFSLITAEFHFDHNSSDAFDLSAGTEIHFDGSFDVNPDIGMNGDVHFDLGHSEIGHSEIGHSEISHTYSDTTINKFDQNQSTPILLILATFFLMFGALGITIYQSEFSIPIIRIILVIILPIGFVKLISILWKRFTSKEHGIEIPFVTIDNQVKTLTNVDEKGGLVLADTGDYERPETLRPSERMKMQAKTLPGVKIDRDSIAYVIAIDEKNTLIIDLWPKVTTKK